MNTNLNDSHTSSFPPNSYAPHPDFMPHANFLLVRHCHQKFTKLLPFVATSIILCQVIFGYLFEQIGKLHPNQSFWYLWITPILWLAIVANCVLVYYSVCTGQIQRMRALFWFDDLDVYQPDTKKIRACLLFLVQLVHGLGAGILMMSMITMLPLLYFLWEEGYFLMTLSTLPPIFLTALSVYLLRFARFIKSSLPTA